MLKSRIILILSSILLVVLIFSLPKVVVDNNPDEMETSRASPSATEDAGAMPPSSADIHTNQVPEDAQDNIRNLREKYSTSENIEKSVIFADSLAELYLSVSKYDSAAKFLDIVAEHRPGIKSWLRAGDAWYEGFTYAMEPEKRDAMALKAQEYFSKILEQDADRLDVKNKLAMTHLSSSNPMKAIMMLREILEQDPANEKALFNMGALSMQSGQYDKAVERFSNLVEHYPENTQARYFLAVSLLETGNKERAREEFEKVKQLDSDPELQATVDGYLEEIKNR